MGDVRFERALRQVLAAPDRALAIRELGDDEVIQALAAASTQPGLTDPLLANVLASEALNRLRRSSTVLRSVAEGIMEIDATGHVLIANPAACDMLGWTEEDVRGRDAHTWLHEGSPSCGEGCPLRALLAQPHRAERDDDFRKRGGHFLPVTVTSAPVLADGVPLGTILLFRDGSSRRQAEGRRTASLRVMQILATAPTIEAAAPDLLRAIGEGFGWDAGALWLLDESGSKLQTIGFWKEAGFGLPRFEEITRRSRLGRGEGTAGRVWESAAPYWTRDLTSLAPDRFPRAHAASQEGLHAVFSFPCAVNYRLRGVVEFYSRGLHDPDEALLSAVDALGKEIGGFLERKEAEEKLRASEARKAGMLRASLDAVVTIDGDGRVVEFNPSAERMFGYAAQEILGHNLYETIVPDRYREAHRTGMARYGATGHGPILGRLLELPARRRDGSEITVELYIVPVTLPTGTLFTSSMRDVSLRRAAAGREGDADPVSQDP